jgi:hypothetical protein
VLDLITGLNIWTVSYRYYEIQAICKHRFSFFSSSKRLKSRHGIILILFCFFHDKSSGLLQILGSFVFSRLISFSLSGSWLTTGSTYLHSSIDRILVMHILSRFPSPVIPLNPHLIPSQVLRINEINKHKQLKYLYFENQFNKQSANENFKFVA